MLANEVIEIEITLQINKHRLSFSTQKASETSRINNPKYWPNDPRNTEFYAESRKNIEEQIKAYQGWVGDCVSLIAERIASIPLRLYDRKDELIDEHPFYELMKHVNPDVTGFMLKELISSYLDLTGECYIYMAKDRLGIPREFHSLRPDRMNPIVKGGVIDHFKYKKDLKEIIYPREDILYFRYPNPTDPYRGASPVQRKAYAYDTDLYNMIYQLNVFKNGAHLKGVLETEANMDEEQAKRYLNLFEETYGGAGKAHKTGVLIGGLSYKNIGISNKDMEFILLADWTMRQLASAYHTPPQKLSHPEHTNLANMKVLDTSWNRECILPRCIRIAEILNTFLIPLYREQGIYCEFDNPVPDDEEFLLKKREVDLKNFVISPNEARKEDGLDPANWGKVPLGPMGIIPIASYSSESNEPEPEKKIGKGKLSEEFKEEYWKDYIKRISPLEENLRRAMTKLFQEQEIEALRELRKRKNMEIKDVDDVLKVPKKKEQIKKFIETVLPRITEMVSLNGTNAFAQLGVEGSFNVTNPKVIKWIKDRAGYLIKEISNTTLENLRRTLTEGIEAGESIPNLAKRVSSVYEEAKDYRSVRIARTETIAASNQGALQAYDQSGVVEKKEWLTAIDERTCDECAALHGEVRKLHENFSGGVETPPLHPQCYDKNTEVYTKNGWENLCDVKAGDIILTLNANTNNLEWLPIKYAVKYFQDKIYYLTNTQHSFDMAVSKNHPFFGYQRIGDDRYNNRRLEPKWFKDIKELNSEFHFYTSSEWVGEDREYTNINGIIFDTKDYCRLMGYYLSEGSTTRRNNTRWQISIAQSNTNNLFKIWKSLKDLPLNKIWLGKDRIYISDDRLGNYLIGFGKSYEKWIPENIKNLDRKYIKIFLDAYLLGDGHIKYGKKWKNGNFKNSRSYSTSSKRMADNLGELIIKIGKSVSYDFMEMKGKKQKFDNGEYVLNHNVWVINELTSIHRNFSNISVKEIAYNDMVYDVEVDNHTILTRRNGKVVWGSNCRCTILPVIE